VDVRTEGQGAAETAWQFTKLVLHRRQLDVLHSAERLVFLTGPPGCGKSACLSLKGLEFLSENKHVLVASFHRFSLAASYFIFSQLQQSAGPAATERIHIHTCQLPESRVSGVEMEAAVASAVSAKLTSSGEGELLVIVDEVQYVVFLIF
jgi:hypothetical protein